MTAMLRVLIGAAVLIGSNALADPQINDERARFHYQLMCQGCHTPDGSGGRGVPDMNGVVGHFLHSQKGREYLVRVPGSANSTLDDSELAEVLNWIILEFGNDSVPEAWRPYSAAEVAEYREEPLLEVMRYRARLLAEIEPVSDDG